MLDKKVPTFGWIKFVVGAVCFAADMATKEWARNCLTGDSEIALVPGLLNFNLVTNTGAAFNLGSGHALTMTIIASTVTLLLITWVLREEKRATTSRLFINIGAGFLIGGAIGNLADRFLRGRVTDFIELAFVRFPVFNCADVFIDIGVGLLIIAAWRNMQTTKTEVTQVAVQPAAQATNETDKSRS
ncbi:MAG TPA: signal peptidase II [Oculatellaceae cyanobacterium]